ncbi:Zinc finger protein 598 [Sciurus carolinensis]|uniref:Zinc finger protein 598 n=1 Tax=Sciurus carolinensis TaxID=30640 RepID=A0AA41MMT2_SCICA|nr:Zinc finger protein 598 [Sciurus carolinensis]
MGEGVGAPPWRRGALETVAAAAPKRDPGSCLLCCRDLESTALGRCDHPVCYRCSTKNRCCASSATVPCSREEMRQVVFGKKLPDFATILIQQLQHEEKYDIEFEDGKNFWERNLQLIQSIKGFVQSEEACFSKFMSHLGEFRQGMISTAQYYKSCQDLLGKNFQKIFSELLVLWPDMTKQQELLSAHTDFCSHEKPPGTKSKRNNKSVWQTSTQQVGLDCCVCPLYQQVLAQGDVSSYQVLHAAQDNDFPSLQAIARIIM